MGKNPLSLPGAVVADPENDELGEQEQVSNTVISNNCIYHSHTSAVVC